MLEPIVHSRRGPSRTRVAPSWDNSGRGGIAVADPVPPLRAPSANPPAPGRCPNCNGTQFSPVDNHRAAPSDQLNIGRFVTMCDECGFVQTQVIHGRDMVPAAHRGLTGRKHLQ